MILNPYLRRLTSYKKTLIRDMELSVRHKPKPIQQEREKKLTEEH